MRWSGVRVSGTTLVLALALAIAGCGVDTIEVSGTAAQSRLEAYEQMTATALDQVEGLWGKDTVARPVEVLLPGSPAEFAELTGGAAASQQAPAVTVGRLEEAHVVVHPDSWDRLTQEGRQAVLTHEVTHLSMQGDGGVPSWLGEGLAEYTAHRTSTLSPAVIAGSALDRIRAGERPTSWPDLTGGQATGDPWGGYALSWLACQYLAETWSEDQLIDFYEAVSGGAPLAEALPQVFGVSQEDALAGWGDWLSTL